MELEAKHADRVVPEYSLTGDLLAYRTCPMQYRYYNGSSLPPSRPVQMWYGEFIHGVLETAYRIWNEGRERGEDLPFPWPYAEIQPDALPSEPGAGLAPNDLRLFGWAIERSLLQRGKPPRSRRTRITGYARAHSAINLVGPHLFPLIHATEERVIRTRDLPPRRTGLQLRTDRYVLTGIIDVLTNVSLAGAGDDNVIASAIMDACPELSGEFEVLVDYKGSHRPSFGDPHWVAGDLQLQTYGWLRQQQPHAPSVGAGILIYVNELAPRTGDVPELRRQIMDRSTDVLPAVGSQDDYNIRAWVPGTPLQLSEEFRYARAIRVVRIDAASMTRATDAFDQTVVEIESRIIDESDCGSIRQVWEPTPEPRTCVACDFKSFCPRSPLDGGPDADDDATDDA